MNSLDDFVEMMWDQAYWLGVHDTQDPDAAISEDDMVEIVQEWKDILEAYVEGRDK